MGVPLGFMISETNGGPFEVIGIYIVIYITIYNLKSIYIVGARSLSGRAFSCTLGGWGGVGWGMW